MILNRYLDCGSEDFFRFGHVWKTMDLENYCRWHNMKGESLSLSFIIQKTMRSSVSLYSVIMFNMVTKMMYITFTIQQ